LITFIFDAPTSVRTTENSVFSSAAAVGAPPVAPAITTGAAAVTPNLSSRAFLSSAASVSVKLLICSTNSATDILYLLIY
jgi:hypothetical protein